MKPGTLIRSLTVAGIFVFVGTGLDVSRAETPTFYKDVLPIIQNRCMTCHREGEVAPMALTDYRTVRPWAKSVRRAVIEKTMPPWFADPRYGHFRNDNSLTREEIDTISKWASAGARAGDKADAPPPMEFTEGWLIGEPDQIFRMPKPYALGAEGPDEYKYFTIDTGLTEDKWVQAIEIRAGNPAVVHHIIAYVVPGDTANRDEGGVTRTNSFRPESQRQLEEILARQADVQQKLREAGMKESSMDSMGLNMLGLIAPGSPPQVFPPGEAKLLPKNSKLVFQMHYHRNGQDEIDRSYLGVKYAKAPVHRRRFTMGVINYAFAIPPGEQNYRVDAWHTFDRDAHVHMYAPHMHLRGKSFEYRAIFPDGREEVLFSAPNYDFNWQIIYELQEPLKIPRGTTIHCIAYFDNSADNPSNPDPDAIVRFGEPTIDEMMIGFMDVSIDSAAIEDPLSGG